MDTDKADNIQEPLIVVVCLLSGPLLVSFVVGGGVRGGVGAGCVLLWRGSRSRLVGRLVAASVCALVVPAHQQ